MKNTLFTFYNTYKQFILGLVLIGGIVMLFVGLKYYPPYPCLFSFAGFMLLVAWLESKGNNDEPNTENVENSSSANVSGRTILIIAFIVLLILSMLAFMAGMAAGS